MCTRRSSNVHSTGQAQCQVKLFLYFIGFYLFFFCCFFHWGLAAVHPTSRLHPRRPPMPRAGSDPSNHIVMSSWKGQCMADPWRGSQHVVVSTHQKFSNEVKLLSESRAPKDHWRGTKAGPKCNRAAVACVKNHTTGHLQACCEDFWLVYVFILGPSPSSSHNICNALNIHSLLLQLR